VTFDSYEHVGADWFSIGIRSSRWWTWFCVYSSNRVLTAKFAHNVRERVGFVLCRSFSRNKSRRLPILRVLFFESLQWLGGLLRRNLLAGWLNDYYVAFHESSITINKVCLSSVQQYVKWWMIIKPVFWRGWAHLKNLEWLMNTESINELTLQGLSC